ncbi:MAG: methyltransferase [Candidatus Thorarchaeota archaeon]
MKISPDLSKTIALKPQQQHHSLPLRHVKNGLVYSHLHFDQVSHVLALDLPRRKQTRQEVSCLGCGIGVIGSQPLI